MADDASQGSSRGSSPRKPVEVAPPGRSTAEQTPQERHDWGKATRAPEERHFLVGPRLRSRLQFIDVRLQGAPAGKAILTRECELRVRKLACRILRAQLTELILRSLTEPVEVGTCGECSSHDTFLLLRPMSA